MPFDEFNDDCLAEWEVEAFDREGFQNDDGPGDVLEWTEDHEDWNEEEYWENEHE